MNASQRERFVKRWLNSYERYRYRRHIHAVRAEIFFCHEFAP